jgi:hypothetical protein
LDSTTAAMAMSIGAMQAVSATAQMSNSLIGAQGVISSSSSSRGVLNSTFLRGNQKASSSVGSSLLGLANVQHASRIVCEAKKAGDGDKKEDRWKGLGYDISDDQQDIQRGKGMVDSLFQGATGVGTQTPIMSSYDYISTAQRS